AIAQFVLVVGWREIGWRIAPRAPLDRDNIEAGAGQFIGEDGARPAKADDHDILMGKFASHGRPLCFARCPACLALDAHGRVGVAFIMAGNPVAVVVARAWEANHLPAGHVAIAAIDGIGEEAFPCILHDVLEECFAVLIAQLDRAFFKLSKHFVLCLIGKLSEGFSAMLAFAVAVEIGEALTILGCGSKGRLRSLLRRAILEWTLGIKALETAVRAGELIVDIGGAARILSARRFRVRWNDPVYDRFYGSDFVSGKEDKAVCYGRLWRVRGPGFPRGATFNDFGPAASLCHDQDRRRGENIASAKLHKFPPKCSPRQNQRQC